MRPIVVLSREASSKFKNLILSFFLEGIGMRGGGGGGGDGRDGEDCRNKIECSWVEIVGIVWY